MVIVSVPSSPSFGDGGGRVSAGPWVGSWASSSVSRMESSPSSRFWASQAVRARRRRRRKRIILILFPIPIRPFRSSKLLDLRYSRFVVRCVGATCGRLFEVRVGATFGRPRAVEDRPYYIIRVPHYKRVRKY